MKIKTILTTTFFTLSLSALSACNYTKSLNEGGETGGPEMSPDEVENPPEWHCRERLPNPTPVIVIPGVENQQEIVVNSHETENCPYAETSDLHDPVPGKPHLWGLPDMISSYYYAFLENDLENLGMEDFANQLHPMYVRNVDFPYSTSWEITGGNEARSGLIGNFVVWMISDDLGFNEVPAWGLRPPIVAGTVFDQVIEMFTNPPIQLPNWVPFVNPVTTGRYTAYGMPCSTGNPDFFSEEWTPLLQTWKLDESSEGPECPAFVSFDEVRAHHEIYPFAGSFEQAMVRAQNETMCLDNGGEYIAQLAALSAPSRNGLVWVNWDEIETINLWLTKLIVPLEAQPMLEQVQVFFDWAESLGFQINAWPVDAPWPWSRWSRTGVCGHPASMSLNVSNPEDITFMTHVPCPVSFIPVFGDWDVPLFMDEDEIADWRVEGYCTLPRQVPPLKSTVNPSFALPELHIGKEKRGFSGALFLEPLSKDSIYEIWGSMDLESFEDGIMISSLSDKGDLLLREANVPEGSLIIGTSLEEQNLDPFGLVMGIQRELIDGKTVMLILDNPDRTRRMHRYIVPVPTGSISRR